MCSTLGLQSYLIVEQYNGDAVDIKRRLGFVIKLNIQMKSRLQCWSFACSLSL